MTKRFLVLLVCAAIGMATLACGPRTDVGAAQKKKKKGKGKAASGVVLKNLDNPCGVAVQPGTGIVYVAARDGVIAYDPSSKKRKMAINGYPTDIYGKGPKYNIGPLGLAFLDKEHLVVGDGSRPDGSEYVRIYKVGTTLPKKAQKEDKAAVTLGPIRASTKTAKGEGNFYGVAIGAGAIFVSCNGDDTKGWVAKAVVENGKPGELEPSIATKVATNVDAPVPLTFTPDGKQLVVGQMGEINIPGDSLLTFYDPKSGKLNKSLKTGLNDLTGLAYSPKSGKLYATDFSWLDTKKGALYRLDVKGEEVTATKIRNLDKPTAIAFDSDGRAYITVMGTAKEGSKNNPGSVIVINSGL